MPVDKFGHTDSGSMQRVVAGGVTLTQINNSFLRLDGSNDIVGDIDMAGHLLVGLPIDYPSAGNGDEAISFSQATALIADKITNSAAPTADDHLANKKYVDERDGMRVSKTGDVVTGNLFLSVGSDRTRTMGCKDVVKRKQFHLLLGSLTNKIQCQENLPITLQTTDGFLCKHGEHDIIRFGKSSTDRRTELYQNITMNDKYISDLHDPVEAQDAATKNYVDNSWKKCRVGYVPNLEANNSLTGFVVSASSTIGHEAFRAFNNLLTGESLFRGRGVTSWIQIKCPEPVVIWRLALKVRMECPGISLTASNDGITFTALFATSGSILAQPAPTFFNISTTTSYQYYRLTIVEDAWLLNGIQVMQLYIYDT